MTLYLALTALKSGLASKSIFLSSIPAVVNLESTDPRPTEARELKLMPAISLQSRYRSRIARRLTVGPYNRSAIENALKIPPKFTFRKCWCSNTRRIPSCATFVRSNMFVVDRAAAARAVTCEPFRYFRASVSRRSSRGLLITKSVAR